MHEKYDHPKNARFIHAVVRLHDIDPDRWLSARDSLKSNLFDPWDKYFKEDHHKESRRTLTLRAALTTSNERPRLDAAFVTDLPMPKSLEWEGRYQDSEEPLFQDLLGLAWQLIARACVIAGPRASLEAGCLKNTCANFRKKESGTSVAGRSLRTEPVSECTCCPGTLPGPWPCGALVENGEQSEPKSNRLSWRTARGHWGPKADFFGRPNLPQSRARFGRYQPAKTSQATGESCRRFTGAGIRRSPEGRPQNASSSLGTFQR